MNHSFVSKRCMRAWCLTCMAFHGITACTTPTMSQLVAYSRQPAAPVPHVRQLSSPLADLGMMIRAYRVSQHLIPTDGPILVDIGVFANDGVLKTMPADLTQFLRQVVDHLGPPFVTRRWVEPFLSTVLSPPSAATTPADMYQRTPPTYRIQGTVLSVAVLASKDLATRADGTINHPPVDGQVALGRLRETTEIKVSFTLEDPDGIAEPGGTATYLILIERRERGFSLSLYIAGTGGGIDRKVTVVQNSADALYDAMAAIVIQLFGHARRVPYCRVAGANCLSDTAVSSRVRNELRRLSRLELEVKVKQLMFLHELAVDMNFGPALTPRDRALVASEMKRQSLDVINFKALAEYAFRLWQSVDFRRAAERVDEWMTDEAHKLRDAQVAKLQGDTTRRDRRVPDPPRKKLPAYKRSTRRKGGTPPSNRGTAKAGDVSCTAHASSTSTNVSCTVRSRAPERERPTVADSATRTPAPAQAGKRRKP